MNPASSHKYFVAINAYLIPIKFVESQLSAVLPYFGLVLCHTFKILALKSKKEQFKIPLFPYKITDTLNAGRIEDKFEHNANFLLPYFWLVLVYIRANG